MEQRNKGSGVERANRPQYDAVLRKFADVMHLPNELTDAYSPEQVRLYSFGVPSYDERMATEIEEVKAVALETTLDQYDKLQAGGLIVSSAMQHATNRHTRRLAAGKKVRSFTRQETANMASHHNWVNMLREHADDGLYTAVSSISSVMQPVKINYYPEYSWDNHDTLDLEDGNFRPDDLSGLFSEAELAGGVSYSALALRLREHGSVDLSKDTLDARFKNVLDIAKIEAIRLLTDNSFQLVVPLGGLPRMEQAVTQLYRQNMARFGTADLDEMAGMLAEFSQTAARFIGADKHTAVPIELIANSAANGRQDIGHILYGIREIYRRLGYELPPLLQKYEAKTDNEEQAVQAVNTCSVPTAAGKQEQPPMTLEEQKAVEWQEIIDDLVGEVQQLERPYGYTAERIRTFDSGTKLVRDLEDELASKRLLNDLPTIRQLAILILQSQNAAADRSAYFSGLQDVQTAIGYHLHDLAEIGASKAYASPLINALHWLDEIAEAGSDEMIKNDRLLDLLYDYCVGPDTGNAGAEIAESTGTAMEDLDKEITPEKSIAVEGAMRIVRRRSETEKLRAQEIYGQLLQEVFGDEDIAFVDVVAESLSIERAAAHRAYEHRQRASNITDIDPERLRGLISLKHRLVEQGREVSLYYISGAQNQKLPPFIMYVRQNPGAASGVCVMENPAIGYASRLYPVDGHLVKNWQEVITLSRRELTDLRIKVQTKVHKPKGSPAFNQHYEADLLNMITLRLASLQGHSAASR